MTLRGSGRTTRQMREASEGAIFIWVNGDLFYPKRLAKHLDRTDIKVIRPSELLLENHHGSQVSGVVLDHAANLTAGQWDYYCELLERAKLFKR